MKRIVWIVGLCALLLLGGCVGEDEDTSSQDGVTVVTVASTPAPAVTTAEEGEEAPAGVNPLTGEPGFPLGAQGRRPIAFMVNNIKAGLPEYGIDDADLCYEVPVEGGITRILVLYADVADVVKVGSVRSARHYFLDLSAPFDAIFMHFGGSIYAYDAIKSRGLDSIDGKTHPNGYEQDKQRLAERGQEHSFFATQASVQAVLASVGERLEGDTPMAFDFAGEGDALPVGTAAAHITVPFSSYTEAFFDYSEADGEYKKGQYGDIQIDGNTGAQVGVKNVFVLFTGIALIPGQEVGLVDVGLDSGNGYYAANGAITPIRWSKGGAGDVLTYTNADGSPLKVAVGSSWVCFVGADRAERFGYH